MKAFLIENSNKEPIIREEKEKETHFWKVNLCCRSELNLHEHEREENDSKRECGSSGPGEQTKEDLQHSDSFSWRNQGLRKRKIRKRRTNCRADQGFLSFFFLSRVKVVWIFIFKYPLFFTHNSPTLTTLYWKIMHYKHCIKFAGVNSILNIDYKYNWFGLDRKKMMFFLFFWFLSSQTGHGQREMTDFKTWVCFCFSCKIMGSFNYQSRRKGDFDQKQRFNWLPDTVEAVLDHNRLLRFFILNFQFQNHFLHKNEAK